MKPIYDPRHDRRYAFARPQAMRVLRWWEHAWILAWSFVWFAVVGIVIVELFGRR